MITKNLDKIRDNIMDIISMVGVGDSLEVSVIEPKDNLQGPGYAIILIVNDDIKGGLGGFETEESATEAANGLAVALKKAGFTMDERDDEEGNLQKVH